MTTDAFAAIEAFQDFIRDAEFPCVGAKSALATGGVGIVVAGDLRTDDHDDSLLSALRNASPGNDGAGLTTTVALFPATPTLSEEAFEYALWDRLQSLHQIDSFDFEWDPRISSNPAAPDFGMSIGGKGFFVVGMHPGASRIARRAPMALLAFNPHAQFDLLKEEGRYGRIQKVVRQRDIAIQGDTNPMLADHGVVSEASQYSGRIVANDWQCPFTPRKAGAR